MRQYNKSLLILCRWRQGDIRSVKMKMLKKIISLLLAAVFAAGVITADFSARPAFAEADGSFQGNAEYTPPDTNGYTRWTGALKLKENRNYYIDKEVTISGEKQVTLPEGSRLLVKNGGSLTVYAGSSFTVKGELTVEPSARVVVSGEYIASPDSLTVNHGTFSSTKSSLLELSSCFTTGSLGITAFSGEINVYRAGTLINHNRLTFAENSSVRITGKASCEKNGLMFLKGGLAVTMNGALTSLGELYLYSNAAVSGTVTLGAGSEFYTANGARFTFTKAGVLIDDRGKPVSDTEPAEESPDMSAYDAEPEKVNWIGIDVSRYQGAIDWEKVKKSGVDFVLLRSSIGDGSTIFSGEDIRFSVNVVEAKKAGLMVGAYHYLWAETAEDAIKEAKLFIRTIAPYALDFPAVLDFEEPSQQENLTTAERTLIARVFLEEVKSAGYYPMLYTNKSWATNYLNMRQLSDYEVWLAEWFPQPSYSGDFGIWQYTAYGKVSGIEGDVDLDVCYKNYRKIILDGGYNHLK